MTYLFPALVCATMLAVAGCAAPRSAAPVPAEPTPATACTLSGVPLAEVAAAYDEATLVAVTRIARIRNTSPLVQSPPPAPGNTVQFHVVADVDRVVRAAEPFSSDRFAYTFAAPLPEDGTKRWQDEATWLTFAVPSGRRVPWTAVRPPLLLTDAAERRLDSLTAANDAWPPPNTKMSPGIGVEAIRGGVPAASGFLFDVQTSDGQRSRLRLTNIDAPTPEVWTLPPGGSVWQQVEPCSLAGARLLRALPAPGAARVSVADEASSDAYARLVGLLRQHLGS